MIAMTTTSNILFFRRLRISFLIIYFLLSFFADKNYTMGPTDFIQTFKALCPKSDTGL